LVKAGADLVSLSEKIDTTTAAGKMVFRMLAVMAEFERDQVAERTRFAMSHKKSKGERVGTIPFGYDLASDAVTLNENAGELEAVAAMRELRARGWSFCKIAIEVGSGGFVTKQGSSTWSHTTIQSILSRTA
jgi:site-specific DNA recombinase